MFDVWVGEPALAPQLAAADYRMTLLGIGPNELAHACDRLLAADKLPRTRAKESREIHYDLRPLIHALRVGDAPADAAVEGGGRAASIWMRLRHSQAGGTGRADEVVAALADQLGLRFSWTGGDEAEAGAPGEPDGSTSPGGIVELEVAGPVRERLWLAAELAPEGDSAASGV